MADQAGEQLDSGLPPNWEVRMSNSKNLPYYFERETKESRWEPPLDTDTDKLKVYMATYHSVVTAAANKQQQQQQQGEGGDLKKIRAAHLLVKHKNSRRPSSWKQNLITRTEEEAMQEIRVYQDRIMSGATTLGDLAVLESDCSSARKRGDLGWFGKGDMQQEFEDAAFALKVGEISDVVVTASGLHLIERLE